MFYRQGDDLPIFNRNIKNVLSFRYFVDGSYYEA